MPARPNDVHVQVDGGINMENIAEIRINMENIAEIREAGAGLIVAGTSVFGSEDVGRAYHELATRARAAG